MPIFLFILKIIGIIVLVIIGLIFLICFYPVRYKAEASYHTGQKPKAKARLTYLFNIVTAGFELVNGRPEYYVNIFGKTLIGSSVKKKKKRKKPVAKSPTIKDKRFRPNGTRINTGETENNSAESAIEDKGKESFFNRWRNKIKEKISSALDKIKNLFSKVDKIKSLIKEWTDDEHKALIGFLWKSIMKILRMIKPKKFNLDVTFGTGEAYSTAAILEWYSVFYGLFALDMINVTPDLEEKRIEADLDMSGRFFVGPLAFIALRVYFNKGFKKYILSMIRK